MTDHVCPLCGSTDVRVWSSSLHFDRGHLECGRCHARGPGYLLDCLSEEDAEALLDKIFQYWYDEVNL